MRKTIINFIVVMAICLILNSGGITFRQWQYWAIVCGMTVLELNNIG